MASPVAGGGGNEPSFKWQNASAPLLYTVAKIGTAAMSADQATAKTDKILGVVQEVPSSTQTATKWHAPIMMSGISYGLAGAAVAIGDTIIPTTAGKMIAGTRTTWSGSFVNTVGVALSVAAADLDLFTLWIRIQENGY